MRVKLTCFLVVCICCSWDRTLWAQVYQNEFLAIGIGGRAQGMSGAVLSSNQDVFNTYWNPAGLTGIRSPLEVGAMHAEWFTGAVKHDYIGVAKSLDTVRRSVAAVSVIRNGVDQIPNTLQLIDPSGAINYDNISTFSFASYGIFLSYAQALAGSPYWSVGGNAKVLYQQAGPFGRAWGIGLDLSVMYVRQRLRFTIVGRDITTTYNRWTYSFTEEEKQVLQATGNDVVLASSEVTRPSILPGIGYRWDIGRYSVLVEGMAHITFDGQRNVLVSSSALNLDPAFGLEFGYKDVVYLRGGIGTFHKVKDIVDPTRTSTAFRPSFGIGLKFGRLVIDYALTNVGQSDNNRYSHIFSAILGFKGKKQA